MSNVFDKDDVNKAIALASSRLGYVQLRPDRIKTMQELFKAAIFSWALFIPTVSGKSLCLRAHAVKWIKNRALISPLNRGHFYPGDPMLKYLCPPGSCLQVTCKHIRYTYRYCNNYIPLYNGILVRVTRPFLRNKGSGYARLVKG